MNYKTERLRLRPFTKEDIDIVYEINNHPECIAFNGWESMSIERCKAVLNRWISDYKEHPDWGVFCLMSPVDSAKIGMAFVYCHEGDDRYEIGFRLKRDQWNKGYGSELARGLIKYCKQTLKAKGVYAEVDTDNIRSCRIFDKLDFEKVSHPGGGKGYLYSIEFDPTEFNPCG
ncbi:GNAT family N-acetyltransferase [Fusibacter sp. JL216-2]|uniref:GNAT family N-acetyltransferase n=1 Tax=Fusibacter sp. JL216-2 TaxID=3071453 RepID=UPI003D33EFAB